MGIKKNFAYNSALILSQYIIGLITFPYITRVLGVSNIGIVSFVDSTINYYVLFSTIGIGIIGTREIARNKHDREKLKTVFSSLISIFLITTSIVLIIYILSILYIEKLNIHKELFFIGSAKLIFTVFLIEWFYKGIEDFKYITLRNLLIKALYVASVFLLVKAKDDYITYFILTTVSVILNSLINFAYVRKYVRFSIKNIKIKYYLRQCLQLGSYSILTSMYTTFNVIYLGFSTDSKQVGYYWTALTTYSIILGFLTAFTSVMMPRLSSVLSQGKLDDFKSLIDKSFKLLFSVCFPIIILSGILAPQVIELIAGEGFEGSIIPMKIIMPLILVVGIAQILAIQVLIPLQKDKVIVNASMIGALCGLIINFLIVRIYGSIGSAIVLVFSELTVTGYYIYAINKDKVVTIPWKTLLQNFTYAIPYFFISISFSLTSFHPIIIVSLSIVTSILYFIFIKAFLAKDDLVISLIKHFFKR